MDISGMQDAYRVSLQLQLLMNFFSELMKSFPFESLRSQFYHSCFCCLSIKPGHQKLCVHHKTVY